MRLIGVDLDAEQLAGAVDGADHDRRQVRDELARPASGAGCPRSAPSHQSVADAAVPKIAIRRQFERGRIERHLLQLAADHVGDRQRDVAALVHRRHRRRGLVGKPALEQKPHDVGVLVDQLDIMLDAAADDLTRGVLSR